jgi:hypothetical protein
MRKPSVALFGAVLALASLTGAVAGPVGASVSGGIVGGTSGTATPGPRYTTGSANLDKLANALVTYNKSVTAVLRAPAGLQLTRPVDIVVVFGSTPVSQRYSNTSGNRLVHQFDPGTGALRRERVTITLSERDPLTTQIVKSFTINTGADVLALWDVVVNPLRIQFWQQCDLVSDADPHVYWYDATGMLRDTLLDPGFNETVAISAGFAGTWYEVKASDPLFRPEIWWFEEDLASDFEPLPVPALVPLLPTADQSNSFVLQDRYGQCSAVFSYTVRVALRTYPTLPAA